MNRYLLNFSYIGTAFRGLQRQIIKSEPYKPDTNTVQGCIETALRNIFPVNKPELILSSRTDKGVHSLSNYGHVDLEEINGKSFREEEITSTLNRAFCVNNIPIRIIRTIHIPNSFHCRYNAKLRTYLYRIANTKKEISKEEKNIHYIAYIPIEDANRCFYLQKKIDIDILIKNSKLFQGKHDFRTFMSSSKNNEKQKHPMHSIRTIIEISVNRSIPPINSYEYEKAIENYDYWEIKIIGPSFLYKQIRRIVGTLIAASSGRISSQEIYEMLTIPSKFSWNTKAVVAPPHALYLCEVHYNETDFRFNKDIDNINEIENESIRENNAKKEQAATN
ncbi:tRNA pseudouridine synthase-like 1 [Condylostylus longicornis]|uniref:tRNA pseudouridine synthase-like 1 n=1 Tax=Condylostylus longicornis TaxID=2530218 RepID=UPI00244E3E76|nr:tRNA pseudouridine synthase-like 1 [Condylostylus longicornis]